MNQTRYIHIFKHTVYALLLLLLYILQTVPGLFVLYGQKPIWVVPAAIAIAMMEGELVGGVYGAAAGLLCDMGGFSLFGFNGFFVCASCVGAGLLVIYLMHCNLRGCLLFVLLTLLLCGSLEHFFSIGMWGYDGSMGHYVTTVLPRVGYSLAVTPIVYWIVKKLHLRFADALGVDLTS